MKKYLTVATFVGLVLGIGLGLWCPQVADKIDFVGKFYITFLKYMVAPVVFTTIAVSIYESRDLSNRRAKCQIHRSFGNFKTSCNIYVYIII